MNLNEAFKSPLRLKIVEFYNENPSCIETSRGVAVWLGVDRRKAKKALEELAKFKILLAHRTQVATGYSYTQSRAIINMINRYIKGGRG